MEIYILNEAIISIVSRDEGGIQAVGREING